MKLLMIVKNIDIEIEVFRTDDILVPQIKLLLRI